MNLQHDSSRIYSMIQVFKTENLQQQSSTVYNTNNILLNQKLPHKVCLFKITKLLNVELHVNLPQFKEDLTKLGSHFE